MAEEKFTGKIMTNFGTIGDLKEILSELKEAAPSIKFSKATEVNGPDDSWGNF